MGSKTVSKRVRTVCALNRSRTAAPIQKGDLLAQWSLGSSFSEVVDWESRPNHLITLCHLVPPCATRPSRLKGGAVTVFSCQWGGRGLRATRPSRLQGGAVTVLSCQCQFGAAAASRSQPARKPAQRRGRSAIGARAPGRGGQAQPAAMPVVPTPSPAARVDPECQVGASARAENSDRPRGRIQLEHRPGPERAMPPGPAPALAAAALATAAGPRGRPCQ